MTLTVSIGWRNLWSRILDQSNQQHDMTMEKSCHRSTGLSLGRFAMRNTTPPLHTSNMDARPSKNEAKVHNKSWWRQNIILGKV